MKLTLSEQQRALQDEADVFCASIADVLAADREWQVQGMPSDGDSIDVYRALGQAGLIGVHWPQRFGGRGLANVDVVALEERLGYGWLPLSSYLLSVKTVGNALLQFGSEALCAYLLPEVAAGRLIFCQGFSEPGAGSDLAGIVTRARRDGDRFIVTGHKTWTSSAQIADWIYLAARTSDTGSRHSGITVLMAPMKAPGVTVRTFDTMGGGFLSEVFLDELEIGVDHVVGRVNDGWRVLMGTLAYERVTSEKLGVLCWLLDAMDAECGTRSQELRGEAAAARLHGYRSAWLLDQGEDASVASSMAKLSVALLAKRVARAACDALGAFAILDGRPGLPLAGRAAALLRASVGSTIAGGTSEIQRTVIARRGLAAA
jgi:alkylation response protein AidB-like acyl-CoA dehydrogenase